MMGVAQETVEVKFNLTHEDIGHLETIARAQNKTVTAALRQAITTEFRLYELLLEGADIALFRNGHRYYQNIVLHQYDTIYKQR